MQLINTKISYELGETEVFTTQLNNNDYSIDIHIKENLLKANISTSKELHNFKINFYIKIDSNYCEFLTNGYQTWMPSQKIFENGKNCPLKNKMLAKITKGTGLDYLGEYNKPYYKEASFGLCYFKTKDNSKTLLFCSLNECDTFTKYTFDFERHILKISREFYGYSINKNMEIANIILIENNYYEAFAKLKEILNNNNNLNATSYKKGKIDDENTQKDLAYTKDSQNIEHDNISTTNARQNTSKRIIGYNTFCEFKNNISQQIINNKIYSINKIYNTFFIGDGYSEKSCDIFNIDNKRFPTGLKPIVDSIHEKGIKAGIWIAPFAISPLSQSFSKYADIALKQNNKQAVTCPFWNGAYSIDITLPASQEYLKNMFDIIIECEFDIIYCDCIYLAGSIPTGGKTQAMLINDAVKLIKKFACDKTLIFGGVPYLSAYGNCDFINISSEPKNIWQNPLDFLSPQMPISSKSNVQNLPLKKYMDLLHSCIYTIPDSKKIKTKLVNYIAHNFSNIMTSDKHIIPTTYPSQIKLD